MMARNGAVEDWPDWAGVDSAPPVAGSAGVLVEDDMKAEDGKVLMTYARQQGTWRVEMEGE